MERIEDELDSQQKAVFNKIKNYPYVVKEEEEGEEANINNQTAKTNMDNIPRCFGSYIDENGKKGYRCFGVDIPCL